MYLKHLLKLFEGSGEVNEYNAQQIKDLFVKRVLEKGLSKESLKVYKTALKRYYKFIGKEGILNWLNEIKTKEHIKLPIVYSVQEINNLLKEAKSIRDKCLISLLFESGARIGELLNLQIKDLTFENINNTNEGVRLLLRGKTGERSILMITSAPLIKT